MRQGHISHAEDDDWADTVIHGRAETSPAACLPLRARNSVLHH